MHELARWAPMQPVARAGVDLVCTAGVPQDGCPIVFSRRYYEALVRRLLEQGRQQ